MSKKLTTDEFVFKSKKIHGNKFDYSKVFYKGNKIKVEIVCKLHGSFYQKPNDHMSGRGCSSCKGVCKSTTNEFILKAKNKHGNKYIYSDVCYKNVKTPIKIICPKHGAFLQIPNYHLSGNGCKKCAYEKNLNKNYSVSKAEAGFLDYCKVNERNKHISGYYVDGINKNIIYEFLGDYWHGNPKIFSPHSINRSLNTTFKNLYEKTFQRFSHLKRKGYNIKYIWENDWKRFKLKKQNIPNILNYE